MRACRTAFTTLSLVAVSLLTTACGGAAPATHTTAPALPLPLASTTATPVAAHGAVRTASDELQAAWPIAEPETLLYADIARALHRGSVFAKLVASMDAFASPTMPAAQMSCIRDALLSTAEAVWGTGQGDLLVARFERGHVPAIAACFGTPLASAHVVGADSAWRGTRSVVALSGELLVAGDEALVASSLARRGAGAASLRAFGLTGAEVVRARVVSSSQSVIDATLSASTEGVRAHVSIDSRDAHEVKPLLDMVNGLAAHVPPVPEHDTLVRLARAVHATSAQRSNVVDITFALEEPADDQSRDLGALLTFAKRGLEDYLIAAKQAEARATVGAIAKDVVVWWEREDPVHPKARRRLVSFPAVPKTVPRGVAIETTPDDWKAWAPLRFEMDAPQRYQYEVRAAKDGKSATVIARGDLDGNGKTSLFELPLSVDPRTGMLVVTILKETDPRE